MCGLHNPLRVLDLYSGIGGFSKGLEATGGFKTVAFCEIDPFCRKVLGKHWQEVPTFEDVRKLTVESLSKRGIGRIDVVCGGPPCQSVSQVGKRKGTKDSRWLWPEFHRIICEVRPRWVLFENVRNLLSIESGRIFGGILRDLATAGYSCEWNVISAKQMGAPHLRERVFIVAYAESSGHCWQSEGNQNTRLGLTRGHIRQYGRETDKDVADSKCNESERIRGFGEVGRTSGKDQTTEEERKWIRDAARDSGKNVSNAKQSGLGGRSERIFSQERRDSEPRHVGTCLGSNRGNGERQTLGRLGESAHGLSQRLDGDRLVFVEPLTVSDFWQGDWENGTPRVTKETKNRVNRLKALGNAVLPQIIEYIGRQILRYEEENKTVI